MILVVRLLCVLAFLGVVFKEVSPKQCLVILVGMLGAEIVLKYMLYKKYVKLIQQVQEEYQFFKWLIYQKKLCKRWENLGEDRINDAILLSAQRIKSEVEKIFYNGVLSLEQVIWLKQIIEEIDKILKIEGL